MSEPHTRADAEATAKLYALIRRIRVAMMTTVDDDGTLRSRPMYSHEADADGRLWFFTSAASPKASQVSRDGRVNLAFADPDSQTYISVSGEAELIHDPALIREKWSEGLRTWFPGGPSQENVALVRVDPQQAEYWDSPSSTLVHLYGYAKAVVTGEAPHPGDTRKLELG